MKVLLSEDLFSEEALAVAPFLLPSLFHTCLAYAHALVLDFARDQSLPYKAWRETRPPYEGDMIDRTLKASLEVATRAPIDGVAATAGPSDWNATPLRIGPADLLRLLTAPLTILVEHEVNDAAFLKAAAFGFDADVFRQQVAVGRILFDNGGGSAMKAVIEDRGRDPARAHRMWAIFDSDALVPERPSAESDSKIDACKKARIRWYRLKRRAIENYLPPGEIEDAMKAEDLPSRKAAGAFSKRLSPSQRAHYNLKEGFDGDQARLEPAGKDASQRADVEALFAGISAADLKALAPGFGRHIARRFVPEPDRGRPGISEAARRRDGQEAEMVPLFRDILRSL